MKPVGFKKKFIFLCESQAELKYKRKKLSIQAPWWYGGLRRPCLKPVGLRQSLIISYERQVDSKIQKKVGISSS
jgi:hypothetical protein